MLPKKSTSKSATTTFLKEGQPSFGQRAIDQGEVIACILAGGLGSRLGFPGPKGLLPFQGQPLFTHLRKKVPPSLPLIIMTSRAYSAQTRAFFADDPQIIIWEQPDLPYKLPDGRPAPHSGPGGNGGLLEVMDPTLLSQYKTLTVIPVDNPLAVPYDAPLIGAHLATQSAISVRCVPRLPEEQVGVITDTAIVDYTKQPLPIDVFPYANTNLFCIDIPFLLSSPRLPIHWVEKEGYLKGERFITDLFALAPHRLALISDRTQCFWPIKTPEDITKGAWPL